MGVYVEKTILKLKGGIAGVAIWSLGLVAIPFFPVPSLGGYWAGIGLWVFGLIGTMSFLDGGVETWVVFHGLPFRTWARRALPLVGIAVTLQMVGGLGLARLVAKQFEGFDMAQYVVLAFASTTTITIYNRPEYYWRPDILASARPPAAGMSKRFVEGTQVSSFEEAKRRAEELRRRR